MNVKKIIFSIICLFLLMTLTFTNSNEINKGQNEIYDLFDEKKNLESFQIQSFLNKEEIFVSVIIKIKNNSRKNIKQILMENEISNYNFSKIYPNFNYITLMLLEKDINKLIDIDEIIYIYEDKPIKKFLSESAPLIGLNSTIRNSYNLTGKNVTIAVLDGDFYNHSFYNNRIVYEACFSGNIKNDSKCPNGEISQNGTGSVVNAFKNSNSDYHGSHVAGIVSGNSNSLKGVATQSNLALFEVFNKKGGSFSDIDLALQNILIVSNKYNIKIITISLGGNTQYNSYCDNQLISTFEIIKQLRDANISVIVASGNDFNSTGISAPACFSNTISVGSTDDISEHNFTFGSGFNYTSQINKVSAFSNSAPILDFLAPGAIITSSSILENYMSGQGTSQATPQVSGIIINLISKFPQANYSQIYNSLNNTGKLIVDDLSYFENNSLIIRNGFTKPLVQIDKAYRYLLKDFLNINSLISNNQNINENYLEVNFMTNYPTNLIIENSNVSINKINDTFYKVTFTNLNKNTNDYNLQFYDNLNIENVKNLSYSISNNIKVFSPINNFDYDTNEILINFSGSGNLTYFNSTQNVTYENPNTINLKNGNYNFIFYLNNSGIISQEKIFFRINPELNLINISPQNNSDLQIGINNNLSLNFSTNITIENIEIIFQNNSKKNIINFSKNNNILNINNLKLLFNTTQNIILNISVNNNFSQKNYLLNYNLIDNLSPTFNLSNSSFFNLNSNNFLQNVYEENFIFRLNNINDNSYLKNYSFNFSNIIFENNFSQNNFIEKNISIENFTIGTYNYSILIYDIFNNSKKLNSNFTLNKDFSKPKIISFNDNKNLKINLSKPLLNLSFNFSKNISKLNYFFNNKEIIFINTFNNNNFNFQFPLLNYDDINLTINIFDENNFSNSYNYFYNISFNNSLLNDFDGDGFNDSIDKIIGNKNFSNSIIENINNLSLKINSNYNINETNLFGLNNISFLENNEKFIEFEKNFSIENSVLDLTTITIKKIIENNISKVLIYGLDLDINKTKTLYFNFIGNLSKVGALCIKDEMVSDFSQISLGCNSTNEYYLNIGGENSNYSISQFNNTLYKITGLKNSAVVQTCLENWSSFDDSNSTHKITKYNDLNSCGTIFLKPNDIIVLKDISSSSSGGGGRVGINSGSFPSPSYTQTIINNTEVVDIEKKNETKKNEINETKYESIQENINIKNKKDNNKFFLYFLIGIIIIIFLIAEYFIIRRLKKK